MATYTQAPIIKRRYTDNSGVPLNSGKIYTLEAGGTWPADAITTYQTATGTAHTNPIILDAGQIPGSSEIFLEPGQSYKFICAESSGDFNTPLWTQDGIAAVPGSAAALDISPLTLAVNVDAGDLLYLSDGSGGVTQGTWAKADADNTYSSTTPELAFAVTAGSAGGTIQGRQGGIITLAGPLAPGTKYYVGATAGAITSAAPVNARYVGQAISTTDLVISGEIADAQTDSVVIDPKIKSVCQGRLSLTTGVPVTTGDVTAATTIYWVPYQGNQVCLYSGTRWFQFNQAQLSIAVPSTTATMYDVFMDYNAGTPALSVTAWTNDTTRATALTTQDGIYVKTGALTSRYLGSFRTTGVSGQTENSEAKRLLWNYYNRVSTELVVIEATNSWSYSLNAWQQANAAAANQLEFVVGVNEDSVSASVVGVATNNTNLGAGSVGIGLDSTTAAATKMTHTYTQWDAATAGYARGLTASWTGFLGVGWHRLVWLERGNGTGTMTWVGDTPAGEVQTGIRATWRY